MSLDRLRIRLSQLPPGQLRGDMLQLLAEAWHELDGAHETKMDASKLNRAEDDATWDPPYIRMKIERHGAAGRGSSRAEVQCWTINVDEGNAVAEPGGWRQLRQMDSRIDAKQLADDVAKSVGAEAHDDRFEIREDRLKINVTIIIPETNKQTTAARRKRFRAELEPLLAELGWLPDRSANWYRKAL